MSKSPGTLLHSESISTKLTNAQAWKVRYTTADVRGVVHEATGLVIAPTQVPEDARVMTWCHGTTGMGDASCPSAQPDPARELTTYFTPESTRQIDYGIPGLQGFVDEGWVVCATDYQGLGTPGMHQYTVNVSNAHDAVYIVHAARATDLSVGVRFGSMGWSQGGGAAAAVAELSSDVYGDLELVGTVPMSPGVVSIGISQRDGVASTDPSKAPDGHLVMLLAGFTAAFPDDLALNDVLTPLGVEIVNTAWNTQPVHHLNDTIARNFRLKGPILKNPSTNQEAWAAKLALGSAAMKKPVAPVFVCIDGFANGTAIPVPWQKIYIETVGQLGGEVTFKEYPNDDHFSLPQSCIADAREWLGKQF